MIDLSHVPEIPGLSVFLPQGTSTDSWQIWNKPRGFVMCSIYAIGPGGGGASGGSATGVVGGTQPGGSGGGSGGVSRLIIPLFMLPDSLYVLVSPGGSGGEPVASSAGTAGNVAFAPLATVVSMAPSTTSQYVYLEANAGGGGSTSGGAAGAGGSVATARPFALLGATFFIAGNAGATGNSLTGLGGSVTQGTASQIYGGAGGGGSGGFNGGVISALANTPFIAFAAANSGRPGSNGANWSTIFPGKIYGGGGGTGYNNSGATASLPGGNGSAWGCRRRRWRRRLGGRWITRRRRRPRRSDHSVLVR